MKTHALSIALLLVAACAEGDAPAPAPAPQTPNSTSTDWRERVQQDIDALQASDPQRLAQLESIQPARTRAGLPRFSTSAIHDPFAASVFLSRLERGTEPAGTRAALAEALPRTGGIYADALADLMGGETDGNVRTALVATGRQAPADLAVALLSTGLSDPDPRVRAESARAAAHRKDGGQLTAPLVALLWDSDAEPRAAAARSLGVLNIATVATELTRLLEDPNADVRLEALRALGQIDPSLVAALPQVARMASDPDPRIARLARAAAVR